MSDQLTVRDLLERADTLTRRARSLDYDEASPMQAHDRVDMLSRAVDELSSAVTRMADAFDVLTGVTR